MPAPLIGITVHPVTDPDRNNLDALLAAIVRAVEGAGGLPVLIPLGLGEAALRTLYARLDGVLFSGGGDVGPERYGATLHASMGGLDAERDRTEFALARWAVDESKPLFGICRGSQVLNVALGGTLYRDLSEHPQPLAHNTPPGLPFDLRPHVVQVEEETRLAHVLGKPLVEVNSLHHQALKDVAPRLQVAARAPDGIVEAVEVAAHPFGLGVQWHPECLPDMRGLFEAFVSEANPNTK